MNKDAFWVFLNLGFGDAIVANGLIRHLADKYKDRYVILPCWIHNMASIQWMLSDVPNVFFYPIETEQQLLTCMNGIEDDYLSLGFYAVVRSNMGAPIQTFNPVKWDSEFYRQAGLDPELKWTGFKLPELIKNPNYKGWIAIDDEKKERPYVVCHHDEERGFCFKKNPTNSIFLHKEWKMIESCQALFLADEIHCIDSSMLNLADLMDTPHCKRFVFHRYARKGLPPSLKKAWEIID